MVLKNTQLFRETIYRTPSLKFFAHDDAKILHFFLTLLKRDTKMKNFSRYLSKRCEFQYVKVI